MGRRSSPPSRLCASVVCLNESTSVPHVFDSTKPVQDVEEQLMVLLRPWRVHAHWLSSRQLRAEHRRLTEDRDAALVRFHHGALTPAYNGDYPRFDLALSRDEPFHRFGFFAKQQNGNRLFGRLERGTLEGHYLRYLFVIG